jgi:hypothetical protein
MRGAPRGSASWWNRLAVRRSKAYFLSTRKRAAATNGPASVVHDMTESSFKMQAGRNRSDLRAKQRSKQGRALRNKSKFDFACLRKAGCGRFLAAAFSDVALRLKLRKRRRSPLDLKMLGPHLAVTRQGLRWIGGQFPRPAAQHVCANTKILRRRRHAYSELFDRLDLELQTGYPLSHRLAPASFNHLFWVSTKPACRHSPLHVNVRLQQNLLVARNSLYA